MNGMFTEIVASSCTDALGGLSRCDTRSVPPCFCAKAGAEMTTAAARPPAMIARRFYAYSHPPRGTLVGVFLLPRCGRGYHIVCDGQALKRRPLQFYLVAFRITEIDRWPGAFGTRIARQFRRPISRRGASCVTMASRSNGSTRKQRWSMFGTTASCVSLARRDRASTHRPASERGPAARSVVPP